MKKVSSFLDTAPLWKVFLFGWIITGVFSSLFWGFLEEVSGKILSFDRLIYLGLALGFMIGGLMFTLMTSMMRKSQKFWEFANKIDNLVQEAKTKAEIESIFKNEFNSLKSMSLGNPHVGELKRIYAIMETKHKLIN